MKQRAMDKEQFSYRISKNGKLFVNWHGKQGKREIVLKDPRTDNSFENCQ